MKMILFKRLLGCIVLCFSFLEAYTQSAELNYIDTKNYPNIKAAFRIIDDAGIEVRNFNVNDIVISEGGKIRTPLSGWPFCSELSENRFSAILIFDASMSMTYSMDGKDANPPPGSAKWEIAGKAMEHFIQALDPNLTECAIIEFGTEARIRQWFTNNKDSLIKIVTEKPNFSVRTNYNGAFLRNKVYVNNNLVVDSTQSALYLAKFAKNKPVIIFLTDGKHNPPLSIDPGPFEVGSAYNKAKDNSVYVFVVKIGNEELDATSLNNLSQMAGVEGNLGDNLKMDVMNADDLIGFYDKVYQICSQYKYSVPCEVVWESECSGGGVLNLDFPNHFNMSIQSTFTIPESILPKLEINPYNLYFQSEDLTIIDTTVIKITAKNKSVEFPQPGYVSTDQRFTIIDWGAKGNPPFTLEKDSSLYLTIRFSPTDLSHISAEIILEGTQCSGNLIVLDANDPNDVSETPIGSVNSIIESINPNPASGETELKYFLAEPGTTKIWITDFLGHKLFEIENRIIDNGENITYFNVSGLSDGVYFIVMQTHSQILNSKFAIIK